VTECLVLLETQQCHSFLFGHRGELLKRRLSLRRREPACEHFMSLFTLLS
jgi:hypothetical protein